MVCLVKPIPSELLPDSMTVAAPDGSDGYGGRFLEPVAVSHVRFERAETLAANGYKLSDGASGRIWIDAVNSEGSFRIQVGSKISLGGEAFYAVAVNELRAYGDVHHWEVDVR